MKIVLAHPVAQLIYFRQAQERGSMGTLFARFEFYCEKIVMI